MEKKQYSYNESMNICHQALDLLNIKQFLRHNCEPKDIMDRLEEYVDMRREDDAIKTYYFMKQYPDVFSDYPPWLFNYMTDDEFIEYCKQRYPEVIWGYECIERYWVANDGTNA